MDKKLKDALELKYGIIFNDNIISPEEEGFSEKDILTLNIEEL